MTAPTPASAWPDPKRPGVPLEPEKDGWHVLRYRTDSVILVLEWSVREGAWMDNGHDPIEWPGDYTYISPVHTDADLRAASAASFKAGVEAAAMKCDALEKFGDDAAPRHADGGVVVRSWATAAASLAGQIRALPIPDAPALEAVIREAVEKEREACAAQCDRSAAEFRKLAQSVSPATQQGLLNAASAMDSQAAAIRARPQETTDAE